MQRPSRSRARRARHARRKEAAARGSARLRASLDRRCTRRSVKVQAGTEKRRSNRTEKHGGRGSSQRSIRSNVRTKQGQSATPARRVAAPALQQKTTSFGRHRHPANVLRYYRCTGADGYRFNGQASTGDRDLVRDVLSELGAREVFWKVDVKPGGPVGVRLKRTESRCSACPEIPWRR